MASAAPTPNIEQLIKDADGNQYDISAAAMMFRMGGPSRTRKYISLLKGAAQQQLPGMKRRNACTK